MGLLTRYDIPNLPDFDSIPGQRDAWHKAMAAWFDQTIADDSHDALGQPLSYYNAFSFDPGGTVVVQETTLSVPGHALRCGPETSVTSPLRSQCFQLGGHEKTYISSSRPWECGNPEGISKEGGKPASWLSMLSTLCHFHGLLFTGNAGHGYDIRRSLRSRREFRARGRLRDERSRQAPVTH